MQRTARSPSGSFIRPSASANTRSARTLSASRSAVSGPSSWVTPSSTSSPGPMDATTASSTVTAARVTRCTSARTAQTVPDAADGSTRGNLDGAAPGARPAAPGTDGARRARSGRRATAGRPRHVEAQPVGEGGGAPEVVALCLVDAELAQQRHGLGVPGLLGHRALAHAARDLHERLDDDAVAGVAGAVAHELAIDLQVVEREVLEVVEGAEAGAEVVEREAAPELGEPRGEPAGARDVL